MAIEIKFILSKDHVTAIAEQVAEIQERKARRAKKAAEPIITERRYTAKEAGEISRKKDSTIRTHIKAGLLIGEKVGKGYLITETNLNNYITNNETV